jgi:hypothetical protein
MKRTSRFLSSWYRRSKLVLERYVPGFAQRLLHSSRGEAGGAKAGKVTEMDKAALLGLTEVSIEALTDDELFRLHTVCHALDKMSPTQGEVHIPKMHDLLATAFRRRGRHHLTPMIHTRKQWHRFAEVPVEDETGDWSTEVPILKTDTAKRLVYGVVLEPGDPKHTDAQKDWLKSEEIEPAAHDYLKRYYAGKAAMGLQHERLASDTIPVESYIAPADFTLGQKQVKKGSWVMVTYVGNDATWEKVTKGQITGYSIGGRGERHTE